MAVPERVFLDTNVFLRYLTNDVPKRADAVERLLRRAGAGIIPASRALKLVSRTAPEDT